MDACVKDLSDFFNEIGESCSPPLPHAAGENTRKTGFLQTKAYKSKMNKKNSKFFEYFERREFYVHHTEKSTLYLHSKCVFFAVKPMRAILCASAILCALVDHLS